MTSPAPTPFPGFPDFRSNVTYTPRQFFTVVIPHCHRCTVRIVGYALRQVLGWVDVHGNPTKPRLRLTYQEIVSRAGVSRHSIVEALKEAVAMHCLRCIQPPKPDVAGAVGQSGIYEICWDRDGDYTDDPEQFRGFIYREAVITPAEPGGREVRRATAARKNIPNAFFDYLLPRERLSVIRVVGALLYYSVQWGPAGERKVPVRKSVAELGRLARLSERHVVKALQEAQAQGYIVTTEPGRFDPHGGRHSRSATYAIRWTRDPPGIPEPQVKPVGNGPRLDPRKRPRSGRSPVGFGPRNESEKVHEKESEKVHDINTKTDPKTPILTATPTPGGASKAGDASVPSAALRLLLESGFDSQTAADLARRFPEERIRRQIEWLEFRAASRSRLGMLRRAIENDWERPEGTQAKAGPSTDAGIRFAQAYYVAYQAYTGHARTEPPAKDVAAAEAFFAQMQAVGAGGLDPGTAGRRFGQLVRNRHKTTPNAPSILHLTLVKHGYEFLQTLEGEVTRQSRQRAEQERERRHALLYPQYLEYLKEAEQTLQAQHAGLHEAFLADRERTFHLARNGPIPWGSRLVEQFQTEEARLKALAGHFENHPVFPVAGFWEWESRQPRTSAQRPAPGEVHP